MRILLIADVHANWPALQAVVAEPHDVCLFLGDLVDYTLEPAPCLAWVREKVRHAVRGNHDHGAAQNVIVNGRTGYKYLTSVTRPLTARASAGIGLALPVAPAGHLHDDVGKHPVFPGPRHAAGSA